MVTQLIILSTLMVISTTWVTPSVAGPIFIPKKPHIRIQQNKTTLNIQKLQGKSGWQPIKGLTEVGSVGITSGTDGKSQTLFFFDKDGSTIGQSEASDVKFHGSTVKPQANSLTVTQGTHKQWAGNVVLISPKQQKAVSVEPASSKFPEESVTEVKKAARDALTVATTMAIACLVLSSDSEERQPRSAKVPPNNLRPLTSSRNGLNAILEKCEESKAISSEAKSKILESLSASISVR